MSDEAVDTVIDYGDLIEEVFIKPIRTVVVVDDEFPSLDALLDNELGDSGTTWKQEHLKQARRIIDFCRNPDRGWLVDIHDGPKSAAHADEGNTAAHLHQSDLLVLDYHLDRSRPEDNSDAIGILRELAGNDHFNLVIVYTKGYEETGGDIARVVQEIATGLCASDARLAMHHKGLQSVGDALDEWEDHQAAIRTTIMEAVDGGIYLKIQAEMPRPGEIDWNKACAWPEVERLVALLDEAPEPIRSKLKPKLLLKWALYHRQQELGRKLSTEDYGAVIAKFEQQTGANWIRTERLFVTVVSKSSEPSSLPEKLLNSLRHWNPEPHRLLMSKMRAELDERGVLAEGEVLGNRCLHAGWLEEYLDEAPRRRTWKIQNTVNRHWEGLGDSIRAGISGFAEKLADHLIAAGREEAIRDWYPSLPRKEINSHLNRYVCSKPRVEGEHLTTGHVIQLHACKGTACYWLCLSPACDLVPGQKTSGWAGRLGDHIPFIAVELFDSKPEVALSSAYEGNHLFLDIDGGLKCFSFTPRPTQKNGDEVANAPNPKWEQMFAAKQGRFDDAERSLVITRASEMEGALSFKPTEAQVVAQLRYEYALNLLQRLGGNLSRVGLDFVGMPAADKGDGQAVA